MSSRIHVKLKAAFSARNPSDERRRQQSQYNCKHSVNIIEVCHVDHIQWSHLHQCDMAGWSRHWQMAQLRTVSLLRALGYQRNGTEKMGCIIPLGWDISC